MSTRIKVVNKKAFIAGCLLLAFELIVTIVSRILAYNEMLYVINRRYATAFQGMVCYLFALALGNDVGIYKKWMIFLQCILAGIYLFQIAVMYVDLGDWYSLQGKYYVAGIIPTAILTVSLVQLVQAIRNAKRARLEASESPPV